MKIFYRIISNMSVFCLCVCLCLPGCGEAQTKQPIPIDLDGKYGVVYVSSYISTKSDHAIRLVDEQHLGATLEEPATSEWQPLYYNNWMGKGTAREVRPWITIDFPAYYQIEEIAFFDGSGEGRFKVYSGDVPDWLHPDTLAAHTIAESTLEKYLKWTSLVPTPHAPTRRVLIEILQSDTSNTAPRAPVEIIFYGTKTGEISNPPQAYNNPTTFPTVKEFWGVNTFNDDPQGPKSAFSRLRNYHNWEWVEYKQDTMLFEGNSQNGFNFNRYYANMHKIGLENWPVLKATPTWLRDNTGSNNWAPAPPSSYDTMLLGGMFGQYAEYHKVWADSFGMPTESNPSFTPKGQIRYLQVGNEWDKNWDDRESLMLAWEYAAMVSQVYDSLQTASGYVGLLDAPTARPDLDRKKAVAMWFEAFGKPYPFVAVSDHHYSNNTGGQGYSDAGVAPEDDSLLLFVHAREVGDWIDKWLPDSVEYWRTEYGYDTHPESGQRAPAIGGKTEEEVQAEWIIRGALYHAAVPLDEFYMFMLRDVDVIGAQYAKGKYRTSGFLKSRDANYEKKPSWYYAHTFNSRLADYHFTKWMPTGDSTMRLQKWSHTNGTNYAYVIWHGTSDSTVTKSYLLTLEESPKKVTVVSFADKEPAGLISEIQVGNGKVLLPAVSESPLIILSPPLEPSAPVNQYILDAGMVSHNKEGAGFELVDNQTGSGDPHAGQGALLDNEPNFTKGYDLPLKTTITLPEEKEVVWLYFFDTNGDGRMTIEVEDEQGNVTLIGNEFFQVYLKWVDWSVNMKIRKIHLTFHETGANLKEVLVYTR